MLTIIFLIIVACLALSFPFMVVVGVGPLLAFYLIYPELSPTLMIQSSLIGIQPFGLVAIPLFIFAASIMATGRSSRNLIDLARAFTQHLRGGLPITTSLSCALFGAVSGSTQATVVAIGGTLRPELIKRGYSEEFSTALVINASDLAPLIPPSASMIIYGVMTRTSIGSLFIGGLGPALIVLILFSLYSYYISGSIPRVKKMPIKERKKAIRGALIPMGFPVIILGGIYSGIFTPTESAAVSVLYATVIELFIYREINVKSFYAIALDTAIITTIVFILIAVGSSFSFLISFADLPNLLLDQVLPENPSKYLVLTLFAAVYFIGCMFVDPGVIHIIVAPILHPIVVASGVDPVHVGIIAVLQAAIGSATPPFGCDLFTAIAIFKRPYIECIKGTPPFVIMLLVTTVLVIIFPQISLFAVHLLL